MSFLHAITFGIVEGITEFLPISSTGHLILLAKLLHLPQTKVQESFEIAIQLGAILAACVFYARKIFRSWAVLLRVLIAFIPTGVIGFALHKIVKEYLLGSDVIVLWALGIGGVILILIERWKGDTSSKEIPIENISLLQSFWIGVAQAVAIIPGISRSGATIVGGMSMGIPRKTIVDFSFLLAIPTMLAATGYDMLKTYSAFSTSDVSLLAIGFVTSFIVALLSIWWLLRFIKQHSFTGFGIYRILAAIAFYLIILR